MPIKSLVHYPYAYWLNLKYLTRIALGLEAARPVEPDGHPLPPAPLRYRVHGSVKPDGFLIVGMNCARDIRQILTDHGHSFSDFKKVLDFGCGCGRVLRFLHLDGSHTKELVGTDIDPQAIRWCRKHLPFARWDVNGALPPMRYECDSFNLVIAISVFTHLDESYQNAWLQEIDRILKPNGWFIATLHGKQFEDKVQEEGAEALRERGICSQVTQTGSLKLDGLPDYYQATFHSRQYVERVWGERFEILEYRERGMNGRQDAVLMKKRPSA